jgi:hypothetical protein
MELINEDFIDNIITNLKILNLLQVNEKLSIRKGHLQIDKESNVQFMVRWFNRDSRDTILVFIKELIRNINTSFNKMKYLKGSADYSENNLIRIINELEKSEIGLSNLKTTYAFDPVTTVIIENFIDKLRETTFYGKSLI